MFFLSNPRPLTPSLAPDLLAPDPILFTIFMIFFFQGLKSKCHHRCHHQHQNYTNKLPKLTRQYQIQLCTIILN